MFDSGAVIYRYGILLHVIAKSALVEFWSRHPESKSALEAWYRLVEAADFENFAALRRTFASADYVKGLTVFDIGGNKYRLVAAIHYNRQKAFIRNVMTHAEYDKGHWKRRH